MLGGPPQIFVRGAPFCVQCRMCPSVCGVVCAICVRIAVCVSLCCVRSPLFFAKQRIILHFARALHCNNAPPCGILYF